MIPLFPPNDDIIAFLRACKETPEDDAPRLIFADYLEENGHEERADLIRVQCELARLPVDNPKATQLQQREHKSILALRHQWLQPWCEGYCFEEQQRFTRGLAHLVLDANAFVEFCVGSPQAVKHFSWCSELRLFGIDDSTIADLINYLKDIEMLNTLSLVQTRYVDEELLEKHLDLFWTTTKSTQLRTIEIESWYHNAGLRSLLISRQLNKLKTLRISDAIFDDSLGQLLANPLNLPALQSVELHRCFGPPRVNNALKLRFGQGLIGILKINS